MANKEKLIASAQKLLGKGRLSKAIEYMEKVVKMDPKDSRWRLKVAELYAQQGDKDKAVQVYEEMGKFFLDNNFSLKAIAVFKQILKLAPEKKELHKQLGELNEQQGLLGNALSEYRQLAEYYQQEELISETLSVLKKIAELDPKNIGVRMRVAEYSFKLDAKDEAKKELGNILTILESKEDCSTLGKFYEFYLSLFPGEFAIELAAAEWQLTTESFHDGIDALEKMRQREPEHPQLLELLAQGYEQAGDAVKSQSVLEDLLRLSPEDLDLCLKCVHACVAAGDFAAAIAGLEKSKNAFQAQNRMSDLQDFYGHLAEEFPRSSRNNDVFSTLRRIIKDQDDYSGGVDFESYNGPSTVKGEGDEPACLNPEMVTAGMDGVAAEVASVPVSESAEDFVLEASAVADSMNDSGLIATDEKDVDDSGAFEEGFLEFEFSEEDSDFQKEANGPDLKGDLEEADFYLRQGLLDEAENVCRCILDLTPDFQEAKQKLVQIEQKRSEPASASACGQTEREDSGAAERLGIDIFHQDDGEDLFLEGLMADSQKGVRTVIEQEDTESHFNLGIAYKEMGQYDEAISEFEQARKAPLRFVDCITLISFCLVQKGSFQEAEEVFSAALEEDFSDDDRLILNFEMGLLYSEQGKVSEALERFYFVFNLDPFYRDVGERVKKLQEEVGSESSSMETEEALVGSRKNRVSYV